MNFVETQIEGAYVVEATKRGDERGFFARSWSIDAFSSKGLDAEWVELNMSFTKRKGTIRGLHYQSAPHEEVKFIRCTRGRIFDVIVDLRKNSSTYLKWAGVELDASEHAAVYVPRGCAHGFQALEDNTEVTYPVSARYAPHVEGGVRWNDPMFEIQWPIMNGVDVSEKDMSWPDMIAKTS